MKPNHVHVGHRARLKAKFERVGLDGFEDHEVLEFLLTFAIPQKDVNPLAHELISHFGSLNAVLNATTTQLTELPGIGLHAATLITLIPKLAKRYLDDPASKKRYSMAKIADRISYFVPKFIGANEEWLYVAFLNNKLDVISCELVSRGSIDSVMVDYRKLIDMAMRFKSTVIVLAHNHLSNAFPSMDDIMITNSMSEKLEPCDVLLLDHIIVCGGTGVSMAREGKIRRVR